MTERRPGDIDRANDLDPEEEAFARAFREATGQARPSAASCPSGEEIQAAEADALPEEAARVVREHVAGCASCRVLATALGEWPGPDLTPHEQERLWRRVKGEVAGTRPPASKPARRSWMMPAVAAAVFAVVVPVWIALRPDVVVAPGTPSPGPPGLRPSTVLPLEKLEPRTPPTSVLVWRDEGRPSFRHELEDALSPYRAGEFAEAARRLSALAGRYPRTPAIRLYLGISQLFLGQHDQAIAALGEAQLLADTFWLPHVQWYLAVACERAGRSERALAALRDLCAGRSEYADRACAAVTRMTGAASPASPAPK